MHTKLSVPLSLCVVALLSACASSPPRSNALSDAHSSYDAARSNPQIVSFAALELKEAGDTLNKADTASNQLEGDAVVNQYAYIAQQQIAIAQETSKRKLAEQTIATAETQRNQTRLDARTAEADSAKQQLAVSKDKAKWQAEDLAAANANAIDDQKRINNAQAETSAAKQQLVYAAEVTDAQKLALADANAQAANNQQIIAQQETQLNELNAKKSERGMVITLGDLLFLTNKSQLQSGGVEHLQKLGSFLKQYPTRKVLIEGFTDSSGSNSYNQELSEQRASAVRTSLLDMGVNNQNIEIHGYGEEYPVSVNSSVSGRQLNRRVEIFISDSKGNIPPR